jgi:mitogen-activated protein kinase kinase
MHLYGSKYLAHYYHSWLLLDECFQPERIIGHQYGIRADVWSAGLSILELVQNKFPYPRDLPAFELMLHISQSAPPKLDDDPMLPKPWSDAMKDFIKLS